MKIRSFLLPFLALFSLVVLSKAQPPKETPILPSGYRVHDENHPAPPKVETSGATEISAPSDAVVLFDGGDLEAWEGKRDWYVKEGVLIAREKDLVTKQSFGSCQLHLEFRVPAGREVKGQVGANSGVFLMNLYEVQIQESHRNLTYPDGQAAALYGQAAPLVNSSTPQGTWQSYDIFFEVPLYDKNTPGKVLKPAKITVVHNGIVVHHAKELMGPSRHGVLAQYPAEHPQKAPLKLQWHQDPIEFRNIWIRELGTYPEK